MQIQNLCLLVLFVAICGTSHFTSAARFNFNEFDGSNLTLIDAQIRPVGGKGAIVLTPYDVPVDYGLGLYNVQIPFKPSNASSSSSVYSFKTSFTFSISPHRKAKSNPGHGLAFVIIPTDSLNAASGDGFLGLLNKTNNGSPNNHVFAVEFDVFQNKELGDINDNHVGIDINSVKSTVSEKAGYWVQKRTKSGKEDWVFKKIRLSSGTIYKAWIEYNHVTKSISVTVAPAKLSKPKKLLIQTKIDLSTVLFDKMYTGFSASAGRDGQNHYIRTWRFENNAP